MNLKSANTAKDVSTVIYFLFVLSLYLYLSTPNPINSVYVSVPVVRIRYAFCIPRDRFQALLLMLCHMTSHAHSINKILL